MTAKQDAPSASCFSRKDLFMNALQNLRLFLLDMDGTFYLGNRLLEGSSHFVETIGALPDTDFLFLTNNSSKNRMNYVDKLQGMGFSFPPDRIMTSGEATTIHLKQEMPGAKLYVVGTPSLEEEFDAAGFLRTDRDPDAVVLGFDMTLTYEKLVKLCDFVRAGLPYIATHPDFNCPVEGGFIPDIGGMIALVEACTGRRPDVVIGKPNRYIVESVSEKFGVPLEQIAMVGDRLYTDIAVGANAGITSVLVLSGETALTDLEGSAVQPDYIFQNLGELADAVVQSRKQQP